MAFSVINNKIVTSFETSPLSKKGANKMDKTEKQEYGKFITVKKMGKTK